jgi:hypothetical protein
LITAGGIALRTEVNTISIYSRSTSGVQLIDLAHDDVLVGIAIVTGEKPAESAVVGTDGRNNGQLIEEEPVMLEDDELDELDDEELDEAYEDEFDDELLDEEAELDEDDFNRGDDLDADLSDNYTEDL